MQIYRTFQNALKMATTNSSIILALLDPISQETYQILVSPEDTEKAGQDLVFATQLFKQAKLQAAVSARQVNTAKAVVAPKALPAVTKTAELINSSVTATTPRHCSYETEAGIALSESQNQTSEAPDEKDEEVGGCIWTKPMVMLLLHTYKKNESNFTSGKMSQKQAWEQVSNVMSTEGYVVPGSKCSSKFSSLKRTYKSVKDHNNKSGNERRTWYFLDVMDELFACKPWMEPVSTASSDSHNKSDTENNSSTADSLSRQKATRKRKGARDSLMERLIEEKKKYAEQKQRQHDEKIHEARKLTKILEKLFAKKISTFFERTSDFDENEISD